MEKEINYCLGLNLGTSSVGWAIINLDLHRIEDLGVRIFNIAENPKNGQSLALPRREARGKRRNLRRKAYRIKRVKKMIIQNNILSQEELDNLFKEKNTLNIWEIRVKGLDKKLTNKEWARILVNLCKRRGYKSNRKNEIQKKETGKVLVNIKNNFEEMQKTGARSIAEFLLNKVKTSEDKFKSLRNKEENYNNSISRNMIEEEIKTLFEIQRKFNNRFANKTIEEEYLKIFNSQRPFSSLEEIEKLVNYCTFEKEEKCSPKYCISAEEFNLYQNLNNLGIICNGKRRFLTDKEKELIINKAFSNKEVKYSIIRKLLNLSIDECFSFLTYFKDKSIEQIENTVFVSLKGYHAIKKAIENNLGKDYWQNIKNNRKLLNDIAYVLTLAKTDEEIIKHLKLKGIKDENLINCLLNISFSQFHNLSIKAIERILPFLKEGYKYNEACEKAGYDFKANYTGEKTKKLPVININEIVNPVVNRALAQTRKVVNAIIDKYGSPIKINIQLCRDLSNSYAKKISIEKAQKKNRSKNDKNRNELIALMGKEPTSRELLKYRLWKEQEGRCPYSQQEIFIDDLFKSGYCEINHIIPFSRSFDDSLNNKVLVLEVESRRKINKTPFEYFGMNKDRWNIFCDWVKESKLSNKKKNNLLKTEMLNTTEDLPSRILKDTQYICKYIANYINTRLEFKPSELNQKVCIINGTTIAFLRSKWGLIKEINNGVKHNALDAAVIAVTSPKLIKRILKFKKAHEFKGIKNNNEIDIETNEPINSEQFNNIRKCYFPQPWKGFSTELSIRLSDDPIEKLKETSFDSYDEDFINNTVKPIFVSRAATRKINGKLFGETVYSKKAFINNNLVVKRKLKDLTKKDLDNIYNYNSDKKLYDKIIKRMEEFDYNAKKAFEEEIRKPTKNGSLGPMVKSIKIKTKLPFKDGIENNNGLVARKGLVRLDVYSKNNIYYIVPVYKYQIMQNILPKKAVVNGKSEKDWLLMDDSYSFKFSIYKNDLVEVIYNKKENVIGYFISFNISTNSLKLECHDKSLEPKSVGIKTGVKALNKYYVDILGNCFKIKNS